MRIEDFIVSKVAISKFKCLSHLDIGGLLVGPKEVGPLRMNVCVNPLLTYG